MYRTVLAVVSRILIFLKRSYSPMGWNLHSRVVLSTPWGDQNKINFFLNIKKYFTLDRAMNMWQGLLLLLLGYTWAKTQFVDMVCEFLLDLRQLQHKLHLLSLVALAALLYVCLILVPAARCAHAEYKGWQGRPYHRLTRTEIRRGSF